jgi:hypothetical protein
MTSGLHKLEEVGMSNPLADCESTVIRVGVAALASGLLAAVTRYAKKRWNRPSVADQLASDVQQMKDIIAPSQPEKANLDARLDSQDRRIESLSLRVDNVMLIQSQNHSEVMGLLLKVAKR